MRKILYKLTYDGQYEEGWFHKWIQMRNDTEETFLYAVIETTAGEIILAYFSYVRFPTQPEPVLLPFISPVKQPTDNYYQRWNVPTTCTNKTEQTNEQTD